MKLLKTAALGMLLAGAAWMPTFANGYEEAVQVTSDPQVAYTLYVGIPSSEAEATFDSLSDWTKHEHVQASGNGITVYYTRTLKDGTKQKVSFPRSRTYGAHFIIMEFYTPKAADAHKMYLQALNTMTKKMGQPKSRGHNSTNDFAHFEADDGFTVNLIYTPREKSFKIIREYVYH